MKRSFPFVFFILILILVGCGKKDVSKKEALFFYPNRQISYGSENGAFSTEQRDDAYVSQEALIALYLKGPLQSDLYNPFPNGTELVDLQLDDSEAVLTISDDYASLSGLSLSIANACLAQTALSLLNVQAVTIQCETETISGESFIRFTEQSLVLFDETSGANSAATTPTQ